MEIITKRRLLGYVRTSSTGSGFANIYIYMYVCRIDPCQLEADLLGADDLMHICLCKLTSL